MSYPQLDTDVAFTCPRLRLLLINRNCIGPNIISYGCRSLWGEILIRGG